MLELRHPTKQPSQLPLGYIRPVQNQSLWLPMNDVRQLIWRQDVVRQIKGPPHVGIDPVLSPGPADTGIIRQFLWG